MGGTIKLIFQPGEEKLPGGASLMIAEGVLENPKVDKIIGQHVSPELDVVSLECVVECLWLQQTKYI